MAYGQWIEIKIEVEDNITLILDSATLFYGKFHKANNKNAEIPASSITGTTIRKGASYTVYSCGRSGSASGTQGVLFFLYENEYAGTFSWDCPWSGSNSFHFSDFRIPLPGEVKKPLPVKAIMSGGSKEGSIGCVTLSFSKL